MAKMRARGRVGWVLSDFAPFIACAFLIYVPFFFHAPSDSFPIALVVDPLQHALVGGATILLILGSAFTGVSLGRRSRTRIKVAVTTRMRITLWAITYGSFLISAAHLAVSVRSFVEGDFVAAREAVELPGIGVLIRLPLVTLPLLFITSFSHGRAIRCALMILVGLDGARSFVMSERTALIEAVCVLLVFARFSGIRIRLPTMIGASVVVGVLFAAILETRLYVQSALGSTVQPDDTTLIQSLAAYYADTTNKYYQALDGSLRYPVMTATIPFQALVGGRHVIMEGYNDYLRVLEGFSPYIISGLNNSGGLAEDISDFGMFGFVVAALKFLILGFLMARAGSSVIASGMSVLTLIAILEYPRFNYFNMPFALYLAVAALLLGLLVRGNRARVRRAISRAGYV